MSNSDFEQHLQQQIEQLPDNQLPKRDLWPGIEMAINQRKEKTSPRYLAMAASVALLCTVGWMTWQIAFMPSAKTDLATTLSNQHQQQLQALLVSFEGQAALTNNWQQQIAELDEAAEAIKKALRNEPDNMALLKMLQQVYQQQINLIEKVHSPKWQRI